LFVDWKDGEKAHKLVNEVLEWDSKEHMLQW
jgi:hypothetical protein